MYKHALIWTLLSLTFLIPLFALQSCRKQDRELISEPATESLQEDTLNNAYIIPDFLDALTNANPTIIEELSDDDENLRIFMESTGLNAEEELKKYLESKREYDKSNVFNGIP